MIDYSPLFKTMETKKVSMKELEEHLHQFNFREKVESGDYLNLSTIDKICSFMNCQIPDVIKWAPGPQVHIELERPVFAKVNWRKVTSMLKTSQRTLSRDMGYKPGWYACIKRVEWINIETLKAIKSCIQKTYTEEINIDDFIIETRVGRAEWTTIPF